MNSGTPFGVEAQASWLWWAKTPESLVLQRNPLACSLFTACLPRSACLLTTLLPRPPSRLPSRSKAREGR